MEKKLKEGLNDALNAIPTLIDLYNDNEMSNGYDNGRYIMYELLNLLDCFVSQKEAREVVELIKEAKDIAEDEEEIEDLVKEEGEIVQRYDKLFKRVEEIERRLKDNEVI